MASQDESDPSASSTSKPNHLEPSPLGTKEYWNTLYTTELTNHAHDPSDVGTIWFADSSAEEKMLAFLRKPELGLDAQTTSFLDLGTGNGHFLLRLRGLLRGDDDGEEEEESEEEDEEMTVERKSFRGRMLGTDYSPQSVELAAQIAAAHASSDSDTTESIEFRLWDLILDPPFPVVLDGPNSDGWDVVLDKGTFDAISLSEERDSASGRRICELYHEKVAPLVRDGGYFLVTSCNWTEEELRRWFEGDGEDGKGGACLKYWDRIVYPSFSFGGMKGQTISSVCFRKENRSSSVR